MSVSAQFGEGFETSLGDELKRYTRNLQGSKTQKVVDALAKAIELRVSIGIKTKLSSDVPPIIPEDELNTKFLFETVVVDNRVDVNVRKAEEEENETFFLASFYNSEVLFYTDKPEIFTDFCRTNVYLFDSMHWILQQICVKLGEGLETDFGHLHATFNPPLSQHFREWRR